MECFIEQIFVIIHITNFTFSLPKLTHATLKPVLTLANLAKY